MVLEPVKHGSVADVFRLVVEMLESFVDGDKDGAVCICRVKILNNLVVLVDKLRYDACVVALGNKLVDGLVVDSVGV